MKGIDIIQAGGFIMYPLLVFSVLAWAIGLQKIFSLWGFSKESNKVNAAVQDAINSKNVENIKAAYQNAQKFILRPHEVLVSNLNSSKEEMKEKLSRKLSETNSELKKNLWILGTISASSPFIGLFGTVVGIMGSFKAIGTSGKSGFSVVSAGISESLIATATGIIVAVVALLFYNVLQTRVNSLAQDFRLKLEDVADLLYSMKNGKE